MFRRAVCRTLLAVVGGALLLPGLAAGETRVEGTLHGETKWTKEGSPYIVTGDIIVPTGASLHIGPGVTVRFKPDIASQEGVNAFDLEILVEGTLTVEGAEKDTVQFTSDAMRPAWTDWQGIVVRGEEAKADIRTAIIEFANMGIQGFQGDLTCRDVTVRRCYQYGIVLLQSSAELDNVFITQIGNMGGTGIGINVDRGSEPRIRNSFVVGAQNGIVFARSSGGVVENTMVSMCATRGVIIKNSNPTLTGCTITGNDLGIVVSGGARPTVNRNNIFQNATFDLTARGSYGGEAVKLDFSNNWWGETRLGLIEERIQDGLDDENNNAYVVIEPVLPEAVGGAAQKKQEP
jgi:parallel beta-helix repeat protein